MTIKKSNFNFNRAINSVSKPSVIDRIMREIEAIEVPEQYVEHIMVQYDDGTISELSGKDMIRPVPLSIHLPILPDNHPDYLKQIMDIRIFINTSKLEHDVNIEVEKILGNLF